MPDHLVKATPNSGVAPLEVIFVYDADWHQITDKRVNFGDGDKGEMVIEEGYDCPPDASCRPPQFFLKHVYRHPGTYGVELNDAQYDKPCEPNEQCRNPVAARLEIVVKGQ